MSLSIFGFQALWSPYFLGVIIILTGLYFFVTVARRDRFKVSEPLQRSEAIYFILAMTLIYVIKGSPIDLMAHIMFTYHMVQMAFLLLLVPMLLIKGIPWWVWKAVLEIPVVRSIFKVFGQPVIALFVFALMFSVYHLPVLFDTIKLNETYHGIFTFILFMSAFFMNWPLIHDVEGQPKMKNLYKIGYIIANAVLITPACALIIFNPEPLYATYTDGETWLKAMELCVPISTLAGLSLSGPELFNNMTPIADQQMGGVLMKILQEIIFIVVLVRVFVRWWREEKKNEADITEKALREFQAAKKQSEQY
ncbi:cytochrome c oxidase assembly factor CtaG [Lysinibacillus sp. BW-2-10]|uniref:cytochrome c oxidase assembly factor CtaG n=1 Tax=Lysinibacillus sp. BW-2-10 TaxID=2590030 RepID=UPI00117D9800|nr:cytochrome c oxidase assembly factor CtaG [Lysinibacillus sp. BW-2-10]TSI09322.1 cytochrome c oxidase assembly factor CtaG [Lysinibacillus sp. BW-2-10]